MKLDTWSVIIVFLIAQGLFTLSVFLFSSKRRKKRENRYLVFLVITFIWFLCEFFSVRNVYKIPLDIFYGTRYGSWFLIGPLTYFFFKSVTDHSWNFSIKSILHFTPFVIFVLIIPIISGLSLSSRQIHYGMLAVFDHRPKVVTAYEYLYSTVFYLQFIHFGAYLCFNLKTVKTYTNRLKNEYTYINNIIWLNTFNVLLIISLILVSSYLYLLFASDIYNRSLDYIYVLPMGLFIYAVGYRLSDINWLKIKESKKRYHSSSLTEEDKSRYIAIIEDVMTNKQPYLQNDLRIKDLAFLTEIKEHHLSQLINEHYKQSFFDYINKYRVNEAKKIISSDTQLTLLKVAFDAGFNNKTSFVNAFKKFEHQTPSIYRKKQL